MGLVVGHSFGRKVGAAAIIAVAFPLWLTPALGQTLGEYRQYCQMLNGRMVCSQLTGSPGATGAAPYQHWEDGSPARSSGSYSRPYQPDPLQLGRPNPLYGFSR
jgi:hypothetical protein